MKFYDHPIFKIAFLRRENSLSPERCSKVVKFAKNDRLDTLIVLARDEHFSLVNDPKGGPLDKYCHFISV